MYNKVTKDNIQELAGYEGGKVISIYLPTHRHANPQFIQEDQTRLKNNVVLAQDLWKEHGGSDRDIRDAIDQLESLQDNPDFWQQTTEGLAIFIHGGHVRTLHLPIECEERVVVGEGYDVTPLLVVDGLNQPYYLLALAMHEPKLFKGDLYGVEELSVDLPQSPEQALNIDETHANSKTVRSHQRGGAASPHGEGDSDEVGRDERTKYFRIVEDSLANSDGFDSKLPILLAGTDSEVGDFRAITRLQAVLQDCYIQGNHTQALPQDLHVLARPMIHKECVEPRWSNMVERFGDMTGTGKTSTNLDEIVEAAEQGRVDTLVIATIEMSRDSVSDAVNEPVPLLRRPDDTIIDKVALAARLAASQGGVVCGVEADKYLPDGVKFAALYRY